MAPSSVVLIVKHLGKNEKEIYEAHAALEYINCSKTKRNYLYRNGKILFTSNYIWPLFTARQYERWVYFNV